MQNNIFYDFFVTKAKLKGITQKNMVLNDLFKTSNINLKQSQINATLCQLQK